MVNENFYTWLFLLWGLESRGLMYGSFLDEVVQLGSRFIPLVQPQFSLFFHILLFFFSSILEILSSIFFYIHDGVFGGRAHVCELKSVFLL